MPVDVIHLAPPALLAIIAAAFLGGLFMGVVWGAWITRQQEQENERERRQFRGKWAK